MNPKQQASRVLRLGALAALLVGCSGLPPTPAQLPAATAVPLGSGIDLASLDRRVRPADDLYGFVAGGWLERTEIPADRASWGTFAMLRARSAQRVHAIVAALAEEPAPRGSEARRVAAFYRSFMDEAQIERVGLRPLAIERARVAALRGASDLAGWLGHAQRLGRFDAQGNRIGLDAPLAMGVFADLKDSRVYAVQLSEAGLTLPDRDYYLSAEPRYAQIRTAYLAYAADLLTLAGDAEAARRAPALLALETALARAQTSVAEDRDPLTTYNPRTIEQLRAAVPGLDWQRFLGEAGVRPASLIVQQPAYLAALAELTHSVPIEDWRAWLEFKLLDAYAPLLPATYDSLHFGFHEHTLLGVDAARPRWQRALEFLDLTLPEAVGRVYAEREFSAASKAHAQRIVRSVLSEFGRSIESLEWMSAPTREAALQKLGKIRVKIGYPERWRDWSGLEITPEDPVGNLLRVTAYEHRRDLVRIGAQVDRDEWLLGAHVVNAYYFPRANEIVIPAAILQPPLFDGSADDAANYGAIGAVMGHEISHAFDDAGRKYDGDGNLRDWWTPEDARRFAQRADALAAQFSALTVLDGRHVDGRLTLGENLADLSGVAVAWRAWKHSLGGAASPVLDGFSGEQRFFFGWGQTWRFKIRVDALRAWIGSNPHSPYNLRVNGVASNLDAFYEAFGARPGDRLYREPGDRVRIW